MKFKCVLRDISYDIAFFLYRYSDGYCYKLNYSKEDEVIECDAEDSSTVHNGGLRKPSGSASITTRHGVNSKQRC